MSAVQVCGPGGARDGGLARDRRVRSLLELVADVGLIVVTGTATSDGRRCRRSPRPSRRSFPVLPTAAAVRSWM